MILAHDLTIARDRATATPPSKRRRSYRVEAVEREGSSSSCSWSGCECIDSDEEQDVGQTEEVAPPRTATTLAFHNKLVLADKARFELGPRMHFCSAHANVLAPFAVQTQRTTGQQMQKPLQWEAVTQPAKIVPHGAMRKYQIDSLTFLMHAFDHGVGAIIGDEMGLGKTLQTIAFLAHLRFERCVSGPFLVVCPLTVLETWCSESQRWCPDLKVLKLHAYDDKERSRLRCGLLSLDYDVAITTYDLVKTKKWQKVFGLVVFRVIVADEGHVLKTPSTQQSKCMRRLRSQMKVLLTGTPVQNNLSELHALLEFICPGMLLQEKFLNAYDHKTRHGDANALDDARLLLQLFMIRRMKSNVERNLPTRHEIRVNCPLSPMQLFWYRRLLVKDLSILEQLEQNVGGPSNRYQRLRNLVMQLRKACIHPYLFKGAEVPTGSPLESMVAASGKLSLLDRLLVGLRVGGHRTVIFSQFTMMLDIIQDYLDERGWEYLRLDGTMDRIQRLARIHQFQHDKIASIMLMSTRAGGLGINLQSADTVVIFDSDWNPQADRQAMARVHRVGQTKPVFVYRLVSKGTIEERVLQRAEAKLALDHAVLASDAKLDEKEVLQDTSALFSILRASAVGMETRALSDVELQRLLDRSQPPAQQKVERVSPTKDLFDTFGILGRMVPRKFRPAGLAQIASEWGERCSPATNLVAEVPTPQPSQRRTKVTKAIYCLGCKVSGVSLQSCNNVNCSVSFCMSCLPRQRVTHHSLTSIGGWQCPQHFCLKCSRKCTQVGGCLFRCVACPRSWCQDCLPGGLTAHFFGIHAGSSKASLNVAPSAVFMRCQLCCSGDTLPFLRKAERRVRACEPIAPIDLIAFATVGSVDETFAFLDDPAIIKR